MNQLKQIYQSTLILHVSMILGPLLLAAAAYFINNISGSPIASDMGDLSQTFQYVAYGLTILGYFASIYLFKKSLENAKKVEDLSGKLTAFRSGNILQTALLEGPALMSLSFYLLTNAPVFMIIAAMLIMYMLLKLPLQSKVSDDLELSQQQRQSLSKALSD